MKTALILIVALSIPSPGSYSPTLAREQVYTFHYENVLGTSLELRIAALSPAGAEAAEAAALREIERQAGILSAWDPKSEFSLWLRTYGQPVPVSTELFEVLGLFDRWRSLTGGALDASAETVARLWKTASSSGRLPSREEIALAVGTVRQTHWQLNPANHTATHLSHAPLALNSFAKSYIVGAAADRALESGGATSVVVNIGGDLVVRGSRAEPVDIADPRSDAENSPPIARIHVLERAVATSGSYRRGVEIGGRHYSHIVDPRTGMPAEAIASSTVVAPKAADAGALATAFSVLTVAESQRLAARLPGVEFLLVKSDGEQSASPGWAVLQRSPAALIPAAFLPAADLPAWDPSTELTVTVELARLEGRVHRPYLAVWIEDQDKFPVRTIALWYGRGRWLPELRAWYRGERLRSMAEGSEIVPSISSATRPPGRYTFNWNGKDNAGKYVKPGKYTVCLEAAREHGTYQLIRQEMDFSGAPKTLPLPGNIEIAAATLDYHKINAR
jgi:thiamine biosynthesis lipoprotein